MWTKLLPEAGGCNLMFLPEAARGGQKFCQRLGSSLVPTHTAQHAPPTEPPSHPPHLGTGPFAAPTLTAKGTTSPCVAVPPLAAQQLPAGLRASKLATQKRVNHPNRTT